jgi:hypothetical protein
MILRRTAPSPAPVARRSAAAVIVALSGALVLGACSSPAAHPAKHVAHVTKGVQPLTAAAGSTLPTTTQPLPTTTTTSAPTTTTTTAPPPVPATGGPACGGPACQNG